MADGAPAPPSGVTVETLPSPRKHVAVADLLAEDGPLAAWLEQRIRRFGANAVHERLALYSAAGSVAARALGVPHLVELNSPLPAEAARYRELERAEDAVALERAVLAGADLVLPVSSPLADYARERGARRVEVMPNAVWLQRFKGLPSREGDEPPVAVFAGALRPWHGVETIAQAWRLLGANAPRLRVIGDGPGRDALAAVGAEMVGTVPHADVARLLCEADIGLAPYAPDAPTYFSPLKLFEYLAAGLAIVAADIPGIRDVVGDDAALLHTPGDADAVADAVARLAADRDERVRLGRRARALAELHTWEERARRILHVVQQLSSQTAVTA